MSANAQQGSAEVQDFLSPKLGMLPAIPEQTLLLAGPACFPKSTFKDVKTGDLCYVVYSLESSAKKSTNWGYLAEATGVNETHVRYHFADVHTVAKTVPNHEWYADVSLDDENNVFIVGGPPAVESGQSYASVDPAEKIPNDQLISSHYEDQIDDVVENCGKQLLKNTAFKSWMGGPMVQRGDTPNPAFKTGKWKFISAITEKIATSLSINAWQAKGLNADNAEKTSEEMKWLESNYLLTVLAEKTSTMTEEGEKKAYQAEVMTKTPTMLKYVIQMMDIMTSEEGPSGSKKKHGSKVVPTKPDLKELTSQVADLKAVVATLTQTMTSSLNAIATQLHIRADPKNDFNPSKVDATPAVPKVVIINVSGNEHECAYHVMSVAKAISDGTTQPSEKPTFSDAAVDAARAALMLQVKLAHEVDPESIEAILGFTIEDLYKQVIEDDQSEKTWPGEPHFILHAAVHSNVELKLKTFRAGKLSTVSTRQTSLPPAKLVMFAMWRPGHFDIMGVEHTGITKIAFTREEAVAAELLLDELLVKDEAPVMSKLANDVFNSVVVAALAANRASKKEGSAAGPRAADGFGPGPGAAVAAGSGSAHAMSKPKSVSWNPNLKKVAPVEITEDEDQDVTAASLVSFAKEEMVRRMQAQMDAQAKQMQAQAQLTLQSRQQVAALEAQLQAQKPGGGLQQLQRGKAASVKPQQPAPSTAKMQQQGPSALDMILNGPAAGQTGVQPALVIWSDSGKRKIEQALRIVDAAAFKGVHSMTKMDAGTPNARFIVLAVARDVALVQTLLLPLVAAGMRVEFYDPTVPTSAPTWSTVVAGNKPKTGTNSKLAGQAQAGLSKAIAKARPTGAAKRVRGQCDYFSSKLKCPRASACWLTCYNGPGAP
jgi:hypothetical protein